MYVYDCMNKPVEFAGEVGIVFPEMLLLGQCLLHLSLQLTDLLFHLTTLHVHTAGGKWIMLYLFLYSWTGQGVHA